MNHTRLQAKMAAGGNLKLQQNDWKLINQKHIRLQAKAAAVNLKLQQNDRKPTDQNNLSACLSVAHINVGLKG